jgi:uncharacterized RDD family membrane protein YckC
VTIVPAPADVPLAAAHGPAASVTRSPARSRSRRGAAAGSEAGPAGARRKLAASWRRLVAFAIDAAILTLVTGALWGRLLASFANRMSKATSLHPGDPAEHGAVGRVFSHTIPPYLIVLVPTIILAILYYWLLTGYWGTTIGKRSVGIWVVKASDGSPAGLRISFLRALVFVLGGEVLPLFFLADSGWLLGDRRRQALHDKAAATLVVRGRPAQSHPRSAG